MAQRQFRFRLPWLSAAPALRPTAEPQPPQIQAPPRPTITIPIQRAPFRPAGIAPTQRPPVQLQAPQRTEPQPPTLPPRATTESQVTSQPASPSRASIQTQAASVLPSPPRASESRVASQPASPSRATNQMKVTSQIRSPSRKPTSPSRMATQEQATITQNLPPSKKSQDASQETSQSLPVSTQPPSSTSREEETKEAVTFPSSSQTSQPKTDHIQEPQPVKTITTALETAASSLGMQTKEFLTGTFRTEQGQKEKEDGSERKKATAMEASGEQIKTASSTHPRSKITISESHHKYVMPSGEQAALHKEIREDVSKFIRKLGITQPKQSLDEKPVSIITLAGDSRGASMLVGSEPAKKEEAVHIHWGYKLNPDDSAKATTDDEGSSKGESSKDPTRKEDQETKAYINSNIQSINNSILLESSMSEKNPGVHLDFSDKQTEATKSSAKPEPLETRKAEFNITPAEKHTYEPTVRRQCLKGLFLEPSDSEPDNPENPRRHGCRYKCREESEDKDIGIL